MLCGLARRRRLLSQEAALKYFLLGAFSSVFFLYGIALAYGYAGSFELSAIDTAVASRTGSENLLLAAIALMAVGLLFKIGAVPFHTWTPDVYQGAPTPVTAFMAAGTKAAAMVAMLRIFFVAFGGSQWDWRPDHRGDRDHHDVPGRGRLDLADRRQADAGLLLDRPRGLPAGRLRRRLRRRRRFGPGHVAVRASCSTWRSTALASIGAFAVVTLVRDSGGETTHLSKWAGLGKTSPLLAGSFALFMLSFAGHPADRRVHRQVGRVQRGVRGRILVARGRSAS